ncbi:MAG: hypothetical protein JWR80_3922, partial [Bradyrhizobium sp.]|nr:hypothetical protein [Bradyrhizobium sp.]
MDHRKIGFDIGFADVAFRDEGDELFFGLHRPLKWHR